MRKAGDPRLREAWRCLALQSLAVGYSYRQVASAFGVTVVSVFRWKANYRRMGYAGIAMRRNFGRPGKLSRGQRLELRSTVGAGEGWSRSGLASYIRDRYGVSYHRCHIGRLITALSRIDAPPVDKPLPPAPPAPLELFPRYPAPAPGVKGFAPHVATEPYPVWTPPRNDPFGGGYGCSPP
jgi:transposase